MGFIPVPVQRDESRHLAAGLIFYIDSFQNPAMEQVLSGRQDSSPPSFCNELRMLKVFCTF